jgi:hypothetical protein
MCAIMGWCQAASRLSLEEPAYLPGPSRRFGRLSETNTHRFLTFAVQVPLEPARLLFYKSFLARPRRAWLPASF